MTRPFRTLYQIEEDIRDALDQPLPGSDAHLTLAPRPRRGWHPGQIPPGARTAAALVLLYPLAKEPHLLLTVRAGQLAQHAGQVSFPGGGLEPNETIDEAAFRETQEEVGRRPETRATDRCPITTLHTGQRFRATSNRRSDSRPPRVAGGFWRPRWLSS